MATKSSKRGNLSVVTPRTKETLCTTGAASTLTAATEKSSVLDDPYDTWVRSQAQSLLGRLPTTEEAHELFQRISINTRKPLLAGSNRPSALSRLLGALRAVSGGINQ